MDVVNKTLVTVQAVRAVARASVVRLPNATYAEINPPPDDATRLQETLKAVKLEMKMTMQEVTEGQAAAAAEEILARADYFPLLRFAIGGYMGGRKDYELTPHLFFLSMGALVIPPELAQNRVVVLSGDDHVFQEPKQKKPYKPFRDERDEMWIKYGNSLNWYGTFIPAYLRHNHCAQTTNHHTCLSFRRESRLMRFLSELSRIALPILDAILENHMIYGAANVIGDQLRTELSLVYTREIICLGEPDYLRAWTNDRVGLATNLCNFWRCTTCPYVRKLWSKANLFVDDLQEILHEGGDMDFCPYCDQPTLQKVYVTTRHGLAVDLVKNSNQCGPLLRHLNNFVPPNFVVNGAQHKIHTLQVSEWYGTLNSPNSHAFVVQVKGDELLEICDSDPLIWPNKVLNEADLRTRNMRVQVAFYVKESEDMQQE